MNESEVVALMSSSKTEAEWNANASAVKKACGGYPEFWFKAIVMSKLSERVSASWGGTADIKVSKVL